MADPVPDPSLHYDHHVFVCQNLRDGGRPCCGGESTSALLRYLKDRVRERQIPGRIRVNASGCLGRCEQGPCLVIYPEGVWYTIASREDVDEILRVHLEQGGRVDRLRLAAQG